jgi:hypothetical protein
LLGYRWLWAVALASILILQIGSFGVLADLSFSQEIEPQLAEGGEDPVPDLPAECVFDDQNNIPDEEELADCITDGLLDNYLEQALIDAGFDGACIVDAKNLLKDAGENLDNVKFQQYMGLLKSCGPFPDSLLAFLPFHPTIMSLHALTVPSNKKLPDAMSVFMIKKGTPSTGFENCTLHGISPDCEIFASELSGGGYDAPWVHEYDHSDWAASPLGWSIFTNPSFVEENVGPENGRTHYVARILDPSQNTVLSKIVFPRNFHPFDPPFPIDGNTECNPPPTPKICPMYIDISQIFFVTYDVLNELTVAHEFYNQFAVKIADTTTPIKYQHPYPVLTLDQTILDEFRNQLDTTVTAGNEILTDQFISGLGNVRFKLNCIQRPNIPQCIPASDLFNPPFDSVSMDEPRRLTFRWDFVGSGEQQAPDLSIENLDVIPPSPERGETTSIEFSIKNLGERAADAAKASGLTQDKVPLLLDGIQFGFVTLDYTLPSQDQVDFSFQWDTSNINIGSHDLMVTVPEATPLERLLSNNARMLTVNIAAPTRPDLQISNADLSWHPLDPLTGDKVSFMLRVRNISPVAASNVNVSFEVQHSCQGALSRISDVNIASIGGNSFVSTKFVWDTSGFSAGSYCLYFTADPSDQLQELREDNNEIKIDELFNLRQGPPPNVKLCAKLFTNKQLYNPSENLELTFSNNCNVPIEFPNSDPWLLKDGSGQIIFVREPKSMLPFIINPNEVIGWGLALEVSGDPFPYDQYKIELTTTTNAGIFATKFIVLPQECVGRTFNRVIEGTPQNDIILGSSGADLIAGMDGDDQINGRGGADCLFGGDGDDIIDGGKGRDKIFGGFGSDTIYGRGGADSIFGEDGDDSLFGNGGNDEIDGGDDFDTCKGGGGTNTKNNCEA